jgi:hypothetical protein
MKKGFRGFVFVFVCLLSLANLWLANQSLFGYNDYPSQPQERPECLTFYWDCYYEAWRWCDEVLCDIYLGCMDIWFITSLCDYDQDVCKFYFKLYCNDGGVWSWYECRWPDMECAIPPPPRK